MVMRRVVVSAAIVMGLCSASLFAQKVDKKVQEAEKKDEPVVVKLADQVMKGQAMPNDLDLAWAHEDFIKAQGSLGYVPFTLSVDASKVTTGMVTLYWRVINTNPASDKDKKDKKKGKYDYEGISWAPVSGQGTALISRSIAVPAGTYDVYVIAKELPNGDKKAPPAKEAVIKHTLVVPDFWNDTLNTSSVIVAQSMTPIAAPLTPEQQAEQPYVLGTLQIVPEFARSFKKSGQLSTFMLIYNPKVDETSKKPNVTVEYNFYAKKDGAEKFFNKTKPTELNAQTLPAEFDLAAGHQLQAGQTVPLASFPEGDYRLEIKVTDHVANASVSRDVNFTVQAS
jgi:hypothetical protein